ncbi:TrbI/VirB10 family protein [Bryobacter aggregatus]|uniref:TrbI/VirB10 family protein n=1 Tax=Bryobacter aggregatus TaxID=360054 RepID=UPI000AC6E783|nr:TrbI/VirB10 family protein [Bryobacter aggregatus]
MNPVKEIESPSGLDLHPEPPSPVRLSKRAGMVALLIVFVVVGLIGYGIYTRGQKQFQVGSATEELRGITAASDAGKLVAAQVPDRPGASTLAPPNDETPSDAMAPLTMSPQSGSQSYNPVIAHPEASNSPQYREPSLEEKRLLSAYEREQEAINSPTSGRDVANVGSQSRGSLPTPGGDIDQITKLLEAVRGRSAQSNAPTQARRVVSGGASDEHDAQAAQDRKEDFLASARKAGKSSYLESTRGAAISRYELKAGWDIPAVLEQSLNSDLPGEIKALVRENVFDTATGGYLLIPQGARLVGIYDSRVTYGQSGLQVAWSRIIYPDASSIDLEGMVGQDAKGNTGLRYEVDNHYRRLLGFGLLTSLFSVSFQLSQSRRGGILGYPSATEVTGSAVGRELSQLGSDVTRRNLNVPPTIKVPVGYRFNVRVNRDIVFEGPYRAERH